jgi:hypothetical protein
MDQQWYFKLRIPSKKKKQFHMAAGQIDLISQVEIIPFQGLSSPKKSQGISHMVA